MKTKGSVMSKGAKIVLILALAAVLALFVILFKGLGGTPAVVPRAPL